MRLVSTVLAVILVLVSNTVLSSSLSIDYKNPNDLSGSMEEFKIAEVVDETLVILTHAYSQGYYFGLSVEDSSNMKKGQSLSSVIKSDTTYSGERMFEKDLICNFWKKTQKGAKERKLFNCVLEDNQWTGKF
ncbi:MAG: hypothetical protein B7X58_05015 [Marinobacter sp. 34-60-7]|nr:MAG: hypothetical protein B7X58_05015 [Marinobacter sp. 34-60-7]